MYSADSLLQHLGNTGHLSLLVFLVRKDHMSLDQTLGAAHNNHKVIHKQANNFNHSIKLDLTDPESLIPFLSFKDTSRKQKLLITSTFFNFKACLLSNLPPPIVASGNRSIEYLC